jgi:aconitate hydratase
MGILPLQFKAGDTRETLGLTGEEIFDVDGLNNSLKPLQELTVAAASPHGRKVKFQTILRIDTPVEIDYYYSGGILQSVLKMLSV